MSKINQGLNAIGGGFDLVTPTQDQVNCDYHFLSIDGIFINEFFYKRYDSVISLSRFHIERKEILFVPFRRG